MNWINPDWPAPDSVQAVVTLRTGGVSQRPYDSFNLASHVNDSESHVLQNRAILQQSLKLPGIPNWLIQTHSNQVVQLDLPQTSAINADAGYSFNKHRVCAVLTADCLPILLCSTDSTVVAAIHAGWRGLLNGIIHNTVTAINRNNLIAWLGPAIGPENFEVGSEVKYYFCQLNTDFATCFKTCANGKYLADLYQIARIQLQLLGIDRIYGGGFCTYTEKDRFYSYRRDGETGRMATLIWRD